MSRPVTQSIYPIDSVFSGTSNMGSDIAPPTTATITTGWTVGKTAANNYCEMIFNSERAANQFGTTPEPSGVLNGTDAVVAGPYEGNFASGTWQLSMSVVAVGNGGTQDGRMTYRIWAGPNPTGAEARLLTPTTPLSGSIVTNLAVGTPQNTNVTASISSFRVDHEYIFFELGWWITGAANSNQADVNFVVGSNSRFITTTLTEHPPTACVWSHDEYPAP